jgi:transposase
MSSAAPWSQLLSSCRPALGLRPSKSVNNHAACCGSREGEQRAGPADAPCGDARAKQTLRSAALPIGLLAAACPWLLAAACLGRLEGRHGRPLCQRHLRTVAAGPMLVLGSLDVPQTQHAIARTGTLLQGTHVPTSRATIFRICQRFRQTGLTTAQPMCGPMISLTAYQIDGLRRWCRKPGGNRRGTRLLRACVWFDMQFNQSVSSTTICRRLKRLGLTRKKGSRVALQQDPELVGTLLGNLPKSRVRSVGDRVDGRVWLRLSR